MLSNTLNQKKKLDPDFGQGINSPCIVHLVHVDPIDKLDVAYNMVVLLPEGQYPDQGLSLIHYLMNLFLEPGDRFVILDIPDFEGNLSIEKAMPVLSFDPDCPQSFTWITPPRRLWH